MEEVERLRRENDALKRKLDAAERYCTLIATALAPTLFDAQLANERVFGKPRTWGTPAFTRYLLDQRLQNQRSELSRLNKDNARLRRQMEELADGWEPTGREVLTPEGRRVIDEYDEERST